MTYTEFVEWVAWYRLENETPEERAEASESDPKFVLSHVQLAIRGG